MQKAEPDGGGEAAKKKEETADFRGSQEVAHFTAPTRTDGAPEVCKCEAEPEGGEAATKKEEETLPEVPHHTSSKQAIHKASVSTQQEQQQYVTQASVDVREVEVDADVRIQRPHPHADDVGGPIAEKAEIQGRMVNMGCSDWGGIFSSLLVLLLITTLSCSTAEVKVNASLDKQMIAQGEQSMFQNTSSAFMFSPPSSCEDGGGESKRITITRYRCGAHYRVFSTFGVWLRGPGYVAALVDPCYAKWNNFQENFSHLWNQVHIVLPVTVFRVRSLSSPN